MYNVQIGDEKQKCNCMINKKIMCLLEHDKKNLDKCMYDKYHLSHRVV